MVATIFLLAAFIAHFYSTSLAQLFLLFVYFLAGTPALIRTIEDIKNLEINIEVLMTLAALLSFIIGSELEGGLLLVLFALSGAMEETVTKKATGALINLNSLAPTTAFAVGSDGSLTEKSVRDVKVGAQLLVKAGETVPLDGIVTAGASFVNLVHLTGESVPVSKTVGDDIAAGSRNLDGTLTIRVTRTSQESTLSKITEMITEAQEMKPKLQRFFDKFGKRYATTIIGLFFVFALLLPVFFSIPMLGLEGSIYRALAFLIAASPCALIIATPTAYLSAISACARKGILLKGGTTLDSFASCRAVAFDKTGTLTTGNLECTAITKLTAATAPCSEEEAIALAAALERHSTHPMAKAISTYAKHRSISPAPIDHFRSIAGYGLSGTAIVAGKKVSLWMGNQALIADKLAAETIDFEQMLASSGKMTAFLLVDQTLFAFSFRDFLRPKIDATLMRLRQEQLKLIMLTGDHHSSAAAVAKELAIDHFYADLRPDHKLKLVSDLSQAEGLAMVGDGINDAPALARATVGISLGEIGSKAAIDAADIVLLRDDLNLLDWLYCKAHKTLRIIRQNLTLALGVICLATTPALLGWIPLWAAVILHEGGTVLVGLNALRLLRT
ncbi:MAG: heavy metal translocating P-type ATPase [Chlamydiota bacterium]